MQTKQQLAPKIARAAEIIEKYSHKREEYILSLSSHPTEKITSETAYLVAYLEGKRVYETLKPQEKPIYCRILDNILIKNEPLRADISDDPVYQLLKEVRSKMEDIAATQYANTRAKADEEAGFIDNGEDLDIFIGNKVDFVEGLMNIIQHRGIDRTTPAAPDWYKDLELNESRYDWLITHLAEYTGNDRDQRITQFVEELPSYDWERFYWSCDKE